MRAGRELAVALGKASSKRKRVAEDAKGDDEDDKVEPRRSTRSKQK